MVGAGLGLALALGGLGVWAWAAPRHWRGESRLRGDEPPLWFPFGEPVWRGLVRSYVAWTPFVVLLLAGGAVAAFNAEGSAGYEAGMAVATLGLVCGTAIHCAILFVNRPRVLVPPGLRAEPGVLSAWARERQRRRRA